MRQKTFNKRGGTGCAAENRTPVAFVHQLGGIDLPQEPASGRRTARLLVSAVVKKVVQTLYATEKPQRVVISQLNQRVQHLSVKT